MKMAFTSDFVALLTCVIPETSNQIYPKFLQEYLF